MRRVLLLGLILNTVLLAGDAVTLRVMSYNVRYATAKDGANHWDLRKDLCVGRIPAFNPDILGLQESLALQNAYILEKAPGYTAVGVGRDDGKQGGEFSTLLFKTERFELLESGTFWLSETPETPGSKSWDSSLPRIVSWAKLKDKASGKGLLAINTHFDHKGPQARLEAARIIRKFANEKGKDLAVVITGDFNSAPGSEAYKALLEKKDGELEFADTYAVVRAANPEPGQGTHHGFGGATNTTRIDWILVTPHFQIKEAAIDRHNENGLYPSDHYPINAVMEWK